MTRRGFTLLELIVASAIFVTILSIVFQSLDMGERMRERITIQNDLNNRANDVLNKLSLELRNANARDTALELNAVNDTTQSITRYVVCTGIDTDPIAANTPATAPFASMYETAQRQLVYYKAAGELYRVRPGFPFPGELLTNKLDPDISAAAGGDAFALSQAGSALQVTMRMRDFTSRKRTNVKSGEDLVYAVQSRVLFLRSTLATASGAAPATNLSSASFPTATTTAPMISFSNLITRLSLVPPNNNQITVVVSPPIGQKVRAVDPVHIRAWKAEDNSGIYPPQDGGYTDTTPMAFGSSTSGFGLTRSTTVSDSGCITITLTGWKTNCAIVVEATAYNASNVSATETKRY